MTYRETIEAAKNGKLTPKGRKLLVSMWPKVSFGERRLINELIGNIQNEGKHTSDYFEEPK